MSLRNTNAQSFAQQKTTMENYQSTNFNSNSLTGQSLPEGNHTLSGQMNGGYHQNQTNLISGGGTYNSSVQQIEDEPMDTTTPRATTKHESIKTITGEQQSHIKDEPKPYIKDEPKPYIKDEPKPYIKDEPKPYIKDEPKTSITDNKCITVSIRGQGNQAKPLNINRTASLDEFISEVNSLFGFGREPGNTYILFNGKQLSRGTQTVEQAGIRDKSSVELCVRTYGG